MPYLFQDIAESTGKQVYVDTVVHGGKNLEFHSKREKTYEKIHEKKWNYVVIQGHSDEFAQPEGTIDKNTYPYIDQIIDSIHANHPCTHIVFYMTWGYKFGNPNWAPISTYDGMQETIEKEYLRCANHFAGSISPVGAAWDEVREQNPNINLYFTDNHHPSLEGSYLSACTFYTSIFGQSPVNNAAKIAIDPLQKKAIETAVTSTVLNNLMKWRWTPTLEAGFDFKLHNKDLQLVNNSKNATKVEWDFGDGHTSTDSNPKHLYKKKGVYLIKQKVTNNCQTLVQERKVTIK